MRKLLLIFFLLCSPVHAGIIDMPQFGPTDTLTSANLNQRWNLNTNQLNGGLDNTNANSAGGFRFHEILDALPASGVQGRTVFLTADNTLNFDTGIAWLATALLSNDQTFTGNNTFSGNVVISGTTKLDGAVDLNAKLTADANEIEGSAFDINGGTMDAVNVDGATLTGMLYTNDASDDLSQLGSQGTAGQFLQSAGAGANPAFVTIQSGVLFGWFGSSKVGTQDGVCNGAINELNCATGVLALYTDGVGVDVYETKFVKSRHDTLEIHTEIWNQSTATTTIDIEVNGSLQCGSAMTHNDNTPTWQTCDIDISSLTDGTVYVVQVELSTNDTEKEAFASQVLAFGK